MSSALNSANQNEVDTSQSQLKGFKLSKSKPSVNPQEGVMTVVNSKRNGKRITLSNELMIELNDPESVQFAFSDYMVAIGTNLDEGEEGFTVHKQGRKGIIYSAGLVEEITDNMGLDFEEKVSVTLYEAEFIDDNGHTVVIIKSTLDEEPEEDMSTDE